MIPYSPIANVGIAREIEFARGSKRWYIGMMVEKKMTSSNNRGLFETLLCRVVALFGVAAFLFLPNNLWGEEQSARKTVRIPCADFSRLMALDGNHRPKSGYAYDYIQAIGTYAKWNIEYVYCDNFSECVNKLLAGEVDLFYDVSYTEDRAKVILYPGEPMGNEYYYLYALDGNTSISTGDYASLNGKTVGVTSGTVQIDFLKECENRRIFSNPGQGSRFAWREDRSRS